MTTLKEPQKLVEYLYESDRGIYFRVGKSHIVKYMPKYRIWMCVGCGKSDCPHTREAAQSEDGITLIPS